LTPRCHAGLHPYLPWLLDHRSGHQFHGPHVPLCQFGWYWTPSPYTPRTHTFHRVPRPHVHAHAWLHYIRVQDAGLDQFAPTLVQLLHTHAHGLLGSATFGPLRWFMRLRCLYIYWLPITVHVQLGHTGLIAPHGWMVTQFLPHTALPTLLLIGLVLAPCLCRCRTVAHLYTLHITYFDCLHMVATPITFHTFFTTLPVLYFVADGRWLYFLLVPHSFWLYLYRLRLRPSPTCHILRFRPDLYGFGTNHGYTLLPDVLYYGPPGQAFTQATDCYS